MTKKDLVQKYFQKANQLTVDNKQYQQSISSLFKWLTNNDKVTDDKTTKYFPNISSKAKIVTKQEGILSGMKEIEFLLKRFTPLFFKSHTSDGSQFKRGDVIAEITGKSHDILGYERTILNILQRMSGIATETNRFINLISTSHHTAPITNRSDSMYLLSIDNSIPLIAATRKTPWMSLDKKAVAVGGGLTHRLNLSDGILIKDNHLATSNSPISPSYLKRGLGGVIEIEVTSEKQAHQILKTFKSLKDTSGVTRRGSPDGGEISNNTHLAILFDNFTSRRVKILLSDLGNLYNLSDIIFEASGGIDESNILKWAKTGVDIISLGSLTHSTHAVNLSLEFVTK